MKHLSIAVFYALSTATPLVAQTQPGFVQSGTIGLYLFNEGSGATLNDSSGAGNNASFGSLANPPYWRSDYGLVFTGGLTDFISMPSALTATTRTIEIVTVIFPLHAQTTALVPVGSSGQPVANIELDPYWNYQKPTSYSSYYPQFVGAHPYLQSDPNPLGTPFLNTTSTVSPQLTLLSRVNDGSTVHLYINGTEAVNMLLH